LRIDPPAGKGMIAAQEALLEAALRDEELGPVPITQQNYGGSIVNDCRFHIHP
jgi:hypothetical protein